jgi:hypothetical protein
MCLSAFWLCLVVAWSPAVRADNLPIYVTPFYNSDPLTVRAGEFSEGLASPDGAVLDKTIAAMKRSWSTLEVVPMYIAAVRLYDRGNRDQSVYWFYAAQHRARLFQQALDPQRIGSIGAPGFELSQAHNAFFQLAGEWVNGYAFCDKDTLVQTLSRVIADSKEVPRLADAYPRVAFIDSAAWPRLSADVSRGLTEFIRMIEQDYESIKHQRDESGATARFCASERAVQ